MAVNYSGLLQTSGELAKAQEQELGSYAAGAQQAGVAMAKPLLDIAKKEQERLDQLEKDQLTAAEWLGQMADTSSLLGDFEGPVAEFALQTKNILNDIAKDEGLSQFEKMAKYKEAVDAFNKRVSKYSGDQEIIADLTGRFAKGEISAGIDQTSNEYQIGRAFAHGKWALQGDTYVIMGDDGIPKILEDEEGNAITIDSSYLKNMYLADKTWDASKEASVIATIGVGAKNKQQLEGLIRAKSLSFGTVEDARNYIIETNRGTYTQLDTDEFKTDGKWDLTKLQNFIYEDAFKRAELARIKAIPPPVQASVGTQMGADTLYIVSDAVQSGNYQNFIGREYEGGEIIGADMVDGKLYFDIEKEDGIITSEYGIDINSPNGIITLGKLIMDDIKGAKAGSLAESRLYFNNYARNEFFKIAEGGTEGGGDGGQAETKETLPEYFDTFNTDIPSQLKKEDGTVIKSRYKEDDYVRRVLNISGSKSMGRKGFKVAELVRTDYDGVFSEANIRNAAYRLNYEGVDSKGRPFGKEQIEAANVAGQTAETDKKAALLTIGSADDNRLTEENMNTYRGQLEDIKKTLNTTKSLTQLTNKDIAIYNYIKAGGKLSDYETALADLQAEIADKAEAAIG